MRSALAVLGLVALPLLGSCSVRSADAGPPASERPGDAELAQVREALRARAARGFEAAAFAKPRMESAAGIDPYQAPLLYLEVTESAPPRAPYALLETDGAGGLDPSRPAIYFRDGFLEVGAHALREVLFVWFREPASGQAPASAGPNPEGLRVIYDGRGRPAWIEALHDSSGQVPVFVSDALEAAAEAAAEATLEAHAEEEHPASTFALEHRIDAEAPLVLVGTFSTGPMAMGPYVYLPAASSDIAALHCRCEPSEAGELSSTIEYDLLPLSEIAPNARARVEALATPAPALEQSRAAALELLQR